MQNQVPTQLRPLVVTQDYDAYTPIDQAVWRYVMRQNVAFLKDRADPAYLGGLGASGIEVESIPRTTHQDQSLAKLGWRAVNVRGFIPPAAFMDFQAHRILPIAADMRSLEHLSYTPAPDIIHESAGHAPILNDATFAAYLEAICKLGVKAIPTQADDDLYEAIRILSDLKEDPTATPEAIAEAEERFVRTREAATVVSEATMVSRLYWWTVEYGLIGTLDQPRIYGAGLLSSVGESKLCLTDKVRKVPFDLDACVSTGYDITDYQPQLFVCESYEQLLEATRVFADRMAWKQGGTYALDVGLKAGSAVTTTFSSGLEVIGVIGQLRRDAAGEAVYLHVAGPTALAIGGQVLDGHDVSHHAEGFGSPIGKLEGEALPLDAFEDSDLARHGIVPGRDCALRFASGVNVEGRVRYVRREGGRIVLIGFDACTVTYQGETLFQPAWGVYDMAVGERVTSVAAAYPDVRYPLVAPRTERKTVSEVTFDPQVAGLHALYARVRTLREEPQDPAMTDKALAEIAERLDQAYPEDWLLRLEVLELLTRGDRLNKLQGHLRASLAALMTTPDRRELIANGLALLPPARTMA
ncbi:aromatic amino acid hydroxylase [bacterium]|nr:aromatic amino acid hydroxylase [bacterium]